MNTKRAQLHCPKSCAEILIIHLLAGAFLVLLEGCGSQSVKPGELSADESVAVSPVAVALRVEPGDQSMLMKWKRAGEGLMSGYNIYIGEQPLRSRGISFNSADTVTPFNLEPYPGDTDPDDSIETFEAKNLVNGPKYYVSVRVLRPDLSLSEPSNEEVAICGPRGEVTLDARYAGSRDGFSFSKDSHVRADAPDNDVYYYTRDGRDYLASPHRLGGYLRQSLLNVLDYHGELDGLRPRLTRAEAAPALDRVEVHPGDWILVRTADSTHAVLRVLTITGESRERKISLYMAFCPVAGELLF